MNNVTSPRSDDEGIEQQLQRQSTAPRVTPADIAANIVAEHFFTGHDGVTGAFVKNGSHGIQTVPPSLSLLTFCVLTLRNGFTVTGESAPASPENFKPEIGRSIARTNAVNKIWPLMGYELKSRLWRESLPQMTDNTHLGKAQGDTPT